MAVKDLLVHIDNTEGCEKRVMDALDIASKDNAHLTGLYTYQTLMYPMYADFGGAGYIYTELENRNIELAAEAEKKFAAWTASWKSRTSWIVREGDPVTLLSRHAAHHDLVVTGQVKNDPDQSGKQTLLNRLLLESPRPVLILPESRSISTFGKRVLVAWNGKKEASRAVHDALPFLLEADAVEVVSINTDKEIDIPCADIVEHLVRHGVPAEGGNADTKSRHTGEAILYMAQNFGADLVVMGAYGHSRLREYVLGGATRHVLQKSAIPVLLSH